MNSTLHDAGFQIVPTRIDPDSREALRLNVFENGKAGTRCLLDHSVVRQVTLKLKSELVLLGLLPPEAVAVQAIAFDKTTDVNWKVTWHQDLMFPFARPVNAPGFTLASVKDGVNFARPPLPVLEAMLAVRLHLDDCDETNGPLRVCPGSHRCGIIPVAAIAAEVASRGEISCLAKEGEALIMKPLLLHASSRAANPKHRRVLHIVYHSDVKIAEPWHRTVGRSDRTQDGVLAPTI